MASFPWKMHIFPTPFHSTPNLHYIAKILHAWVYDRALIIPAKSLPLRHTV